MVGFRQTIKDDFFSRFKKGYQLGNIPMMAKGMVYATLVAMIPCLAILLFIFSIMGQQDQLFNGITTILISTFGNEMGHNLEQYLELFTKNAVGLGVTGILSYLVTSMLLIDNVWRSFNFIYEGRFIKIQKRYLRYLVFLLIGSVLLIVTIFIKTKFGHLFVINAPEISGIKAFVNKVIPYAVLWILLGLAFRYMHTSGSCFISAFLGSLLGTVLIWLLTFLFSYAVKFFVGYSVIYGSLASVLLFLMYLSWSWQIVLTCALLSHTIDQSIIPDKRIYV